VYVAAGDRVEHFFVASNGALTYDGCVSNDGSGGRAPTFRQRDPADGRCRGCGQPGRTLGICGLERR